NRKCVTYAEHRARPRDHSDSDGKAIRGENVPLLAIRVVQQRDAGGAVRVVLDARDLRGHAELVAPEVDAAVLPLVPAAHVPARDMTLVVAAARARQRLEQRALRLGLRDVGEVRHRAEARGRRDRFELADAHISPRTPRSYPLLSG